MPGIWISCFSGTALRIWWKTPSSVPMTSVRAGDAIARSMIFFVEPMKCESSSTAAGHSGCESTSASG